MNNGPMMTSAPVGSLGLGVDAGLAPHVARELAVRCAELRYGSLWSNDEPGESGLETLAQFAAGAPQLDVGVGVLPLDQHPPALIATEIQRLELDLAKLWIGIGSGRLRPQLAPMRDAVAELRDLLPAARVMIGAMRPQLCRLGGLLADGVLLNWMLPSYAAEARGWVREGALTVGRAAPVTAHYIRVRGGWRREPAAARRRGPVPPACGSALHGDERAAGCGWRVRFLASRRGRSAGAAPLGGRPADRTSPRQ